MARRSTLFFVLAATVFAIVSLRGCANQHGRPHGHGDISFDISPIGDQVVFNATGQGGRDLYLLDLLDMQVTRVAATPEYEIHPRFSPDGTEIIYAAGKPGDRADHIFVRSLTGAERQITSAEANDSLPSFSPDGARIVFLRDKTYNWGGKATNWGDDEIVCMVDADGSNPQELTRIGMTSLYPRFSPDAESVHFWSDGGIYAVDVDRSQEPRRLRDQAEVYAAYSPDGESVAYSQGVFSPDCEIFVADLDGSNVRQVTDSDEGAFQPLFTADGRTLLYFRESWPRGPTGVPKKSLWEVNLEKRKSRRLADYSLFDEPLGWTNERR